MSGPGFWLGGRFKSSYFIIPYNSPQNVLNCSYFHSDGGHEREVDSHKEGHGQLGVVVGMVKRESKWAKGFGSVTGEVHI